MGYLGFLYTLARGGGRKTAAKALLMPDPAALRLALGGGGAEEWVTVSGTAPLALPNAAMKAIARLIQYGKVEQDGTPTPDAPVWPVINNGTVGMARPSGLPLRYQMVEWLTVASPSNRITITGFKTNTNQEFECKWYRSAQINCYLYASDASSSLTTNTTAYLATANGLWRFDGRAAGFSAPVETICTSIQNKYGIWINGSKVGSYGEADNFVSTNDLYLLNGAGSANVRFYYLKVRENGNVVLDLVPVRDNVAGTYGVYDKVNGLFYTNADVTFAVGADVEDALYPVVIGTPETLTVAGQTATVPDLYAVGNYKDEYDVISGQITRRVGIKVLDGTEDWFAAKGYTDLYGVPVADGVFSANQLAISTHYAGTTAVNNVMATNTTKATHASILAPGKISVYIKDTVNGTSLEDWKAYLASQYAAGTPVIVLYPLEQPTTEQVAAQPLNTVAGNNVISVTAEVDGIELEAKYAAKKQ